MYCHGDRDWEIPIMKKRIQDFFKHYMRRGISFRRCLKELEQARKYSAQELKNYQMEKLRRTLKIAFENVPFYMALSKEKKLGLNDFKTIEDLHKLPIIDKKYVRGNFQSFRNMNFRGPVFKGLTSGTTGSPAKFLRDLGSINFENAAIFSQQIWAGVRKGSIRYGGMNETPKIFNSLIIGKRAISKILSLFKP